MASGRGCEICGDSKLVTPKLCQSCTEAIIRLIKIKENEDTRVWREYWQESEHKFTFISREEMEAMKGAK